MIVINLIIAIVCLISFKISSVTTKKSLIVVTSLQMFLLSLIFNFGHLFIEHVRAHIELKYDLAISTVVIAAIVGVMNNPTYKKLKVK